MEINKSAPTQQSTSLPHKNVPKDNEASESKAATAPSKLTAQQTSKNLMNQAILSAQQDVNIKAGDKSMVLLYRAAIEAINKELAPSMGENAIQTAYDNGVDTSPEATADRIVSFATQFLVSTSSRTQE